MSDQIINYWVEKDNNYVCFTHAVSAAVKGKEVTPEIAEYGEGKPCYLCKEQK